MVQLNTYVLFYAVGLPIMYMVTLILENENTFMISTKNNKYLQYSF